MSKAVKKISKPGQKQPVKKEQNPKKVNHLWWLSILLLTLIVFVPSIDNKLTNWDDPKYIQENPLIKDLNSKNVKKIFTEPYFGNYQPLHILSYAIEYNFYKLNPKGYHATSVVMHLVVTALVFWFIFLLCSNQLIAIIAALLFGIHPLHVESVAWAAERKDLLYSIFFLLSLIYYLKYLKSNESMRYLLIAFLLFIFSLLSKAMASSLPPVLILIDIYLARKFKWKLVIEKIPFFLGALAIGLTSAYISTTTGQVSLNAFGLFERIIIANFNLLAYVAKLILPIKLSAFYPYPQSTDFNIPAYFYFAPVVVGVLAFFIIRGWKKAKAVFFGTGFFVACIFLVLQLFPVGPTIMSERYSYLSSIGFFFVIGYFVSQLFEKRPSLKPAIYAGLGAYCIFLSVATYKRCDVWKDSMSLWNNVLEQFPYVGTALNNRGNIYGKEMGDLDRAMEDFNKSIQFDPGYENSYANRGIVYCMRGKFDLGIQDFNKALELKPGYYDALVNRGIAYSQSGQYDKSISDFTELIKDHPDDALIYSHRGWTYIIMGKNAEALADLDKAAAMNPTGEVFLRRSNANFNLKKFKEAYADVDRARGMGANVDDKYFDQLRNAAQN